MKMSLPIPYQNGVVATELQCSNTRGEMVREDHITRRLGEVNNERGSLVNGRSDVLTRPVGLHCLQLPHARDVGQPRLDLRQVGNLSGDLTRFTSYEL